MNDFKKYLYLYREQKRTEDSLFLTVVFAAINYCFKETVVETSKKFSLIHLFINVFVNKFTSKFSNASKFAFWNKV